MAMDNKEAKQAQVDANYEAFQKLLPTFLESQRGRFALMRNGEVIGFYSTAGDARTAGSSQFSDGLFSIQKVTNDSINLGFFSHAFVLG